MLLAEVLRIKDPLLPEKEGCLKRWLKGHGALVSKNKDGKKVMQLGDYFAVLFVLQ